MSEPTNPQVARMLVAAIDAAIAGDKPAPLTDAATTVRMLSMACGMLAAASCERVTMGLNVQALRTALFGSRTLVPERAVRRLNAELERIAAMFDAQLWPVHRGSLLDQVDRLEAEG